MAHWLLLYDLAPDYLQRRPAFRSEHLALHVGDLDPARPGGEGRVRRPRVWWSVGGAAVPVTVVSRWTARRSAFS